MSVTFRQFADTMITAGARVRQEPLSCVKQRKSVVGLKAAPQGIDAGFHADHPLYTGDVPG